MNSLSSMDVRRVVPDAGEVVRRAVEDDRPPDEHEPLDEVLDRAELVRDVDDRDAELRVERRRGARRATPATRRRHRSSARRGRVATAAPASALAMNARCCIPPESVRSGASATAASPTRSIASATSSRSRAAQPADEAARCEPPGGDDLAHGRRRIAARRPSAARGTRARADRENRCAGSPKSSAVPALGRSSPSTIRTSVVLPPPFGPATATNSPSPSRRSTSSSTRCPGR